MKKPTDITLLCKMRENKEREREKDGLWNVLQHFDDSRVVLKIMKSLKIWYFSHFAVSQKFSMVSEAKEIIMKCQVCSTGPKQILPGVCKCFEFYETEYNFCFCQLCPKISG